MSTATCAIPTEHASRYLQQLCKHWSHKYPVTFTPEHGRIEMSVAVCELDAEAQALNLRLEAAAEDIERMEGVIARHLERFAFREELQFSWSAAV
jgi:hypothetical protein